MTKMTNIKALDFVLTNCADLPSEVVEKLTAMKEALAKKSSAESKPTPTQIENQSHKAEILSLLSDGKERTITDLMKEIPSLSELSNQRVSALVRQLTQSGEVERKEVNRKAYFVLAE